jgi:hypothetical protein
MSFFPANRIGRSRIRFLPPPTIQLCPDSISFRVRAPRSSSLPTKKRLSRIRGVVCSSLVIVSPPSSRSQSRRRTFAIVLENRSERAVTALRYRWGTTDEFGKHNVRTVSGDGYVVDAYRAVAAPGRAVASLLREVWTRQQSTTSRRVADSSGRARERSSRVGPSQRLSISLSKSTSFCSKTAKSLAPILINMRERSSVENQPPSSSPSRFDWQ